MIDPMTFREGSQAVVHGLRRAFADVLSSVGADPSQPQELSRRFGLDKTLTWRIARVVRQEDAIEAVRDIPRRPSIGIFLKKMEEHGAPAQRIESIWKALDEFEEFVQTHSGDRETLEVMVETSAPKLSDKRLETLRKSGFQANSAVWGVQASLNFAVCIMAPSANASMLELGTVNGLVGLRRLRSNVPWAIASAMAWDQPDGGRVDPSSIPQALHPDGLIGGVPVLPQFSSELLPSLRAVRVPGGNSRYEITDGPVGKTASSTIVLGWKWPSGASMHCDTAAEEFGEHGLHLSTPAELAIVDLLVHRSLTFAMNPIARVYGELPGGPKYPTEGPDVGRLPMPETVHDLGGGPPDTTTPEFPQYRDMVEFATARMGFPLKEFHGFRYRLRYPPIPAIAILKHSLLPMKR